MYFYLHTDPGEVIPFDSLLQTWPFLKHYQFSWPNEPIGPLHDLVTWYEINYAGTQVTQWYFQKKEKPCWTGASSFVLEVLLCDLCSNIINSVPCDQIVQRTYSRPDLECTIYLTTNIAHIRDYHPPRTHRFIAKRSVSCGNC